MSKMVQNERNIIFNFFWPTVTKNAVTSATQGLTSIVGYKTGKWFYFLSLLKKIIILSIFKQIFP